MKNIKVLKFVEFLNEYKVDVWYHGTSKNNFELIKKIGYLEPKLADDEDYGKAIWFSYDIEEAKKFKKKDGVILSISNDNVKKFKYKKLGPTNKQAKEWYNNDKKLFGYDLVIFEKIPLKYLKIVNE